MRSMKAATPRAASAAGAVLRRTRISLVATSKAAISLAAISLAAVSLAPTPAVAAPSPESSPASTRAPAAAVLSCEGEAGFDRLDFWVGEWEVFVGDRLVGTNRIEKILAGCAVMEHWTDIEGGEGKSLFFYTPATETWKQVWVAEDATSAGGVKEKTLVEMYPEGGVRFRGTIRLADGRSYLDRTTLSPRPDGSVRQHIEISRDGETWETTFDARYVRPEG